MGHEQYMGRDQYYALTLIVIFVILFIWYHVNEHDLFSLEIQKYINYYCVIILLIAEFIAHWFFYYNISYKISLILAIYACIENGLYLEEFYLWDISIHKLIRWLLFVPVTIIILGLVFFIPLYFLHYQSMDYNWLQLILSSFIPIVLLFFILNPIIKFILNLCPNKIIALISIILLSILITLVRVINVFGYAQYLDNEYSNSYYNNISHSIVAIMYFILLLIFIIYIAIQFIIEYSTIHLYKIIWGNVHEIYRKSFGKLINQKKIDSELIIYSNDDKGIFQDIYYLLIKDADVILKYNSLALTSMKDNNDASSVVQLYKINWDYVPENIRIPFRIWIEENKIDPKSANFSYEGISKKNYRYYLKNISINDHNFFDPQFLFDLNDPSKGLYPVRCYLNDKQVKFIINHNALALAIIKKDNDVLPSSHFYEINWDYKPLQYPQDIKQSLRIWVEANKTDYKLVDYFYEGNELFKIRCYLMDKQVKCIRGRDALALTIIKEGI
jgi:hypothetical protein